MYMLELFFTYIYLHLISTDVSINVTGYIGSKANTNWQKSGHTSLLNWLHSY